MMIAHPPCTYLANSGVQHLHKHPERWSLMYDAATFFIKLLYAPICKIVVENPIPHRYANLPPYTQIVEPWMFGEEFTKKTCLWVKGVLPLKKGKIVRKGERYITRSGRRNGAKWFMLLPASADRWKIRSRTFQGIANAMAAQWG